MRSATGLWELEACRQIDVGVHFSNSYDFECFRSASNAGRVAKAFFCFGARLKCDNLIKPRSDEHLENRTWDGTINIPFFSSLLWRIFIDPYAKSYARAAAACCFQRSANDFEEFLYLPFVYLRPT